MHIAVFPCLCDHFRWWIDAIQLIWCAYESFYDTKIINWHKYQMICNHDVFAACVWTNIPQYCLRSKWRVSYVAASFRLPVFVLREFFCDQWLGGPDCLGVWQNGCVCRAICSSRSCTRGTRAVEKWCAHSNVCRCAALSHCTSNIHARWRCWQGVGVIHERSYAQALASANDVSNGHAVWQVIVD